MPCILHIDTSSEKAIIVLSQNGKCLSQKVNEDARNHAATINLLIDELMNEAGIALRDVDAYSVIGGPGSYTGLRIGLSTAKALCYVFGKPLILVNKLDLLTLQEIELTHGEYDHYLTIIQAREKEYFMCLYNRNSKAEIAPKHVYEQQLIDIIYDLEGRILMKSGINQIIAAMQEEKEIHFSKNEEMSIAFWCRYSNELFDCNSFVSLSSSEPFYLKQVYTQTKL